MCAAGSGQRKWPEWVERISQPRVTYKMPSNAKPTRWQKPGPMSRDDWTNFYRWVSAQRTPTRKKEIERKSVSKKDVPNPVMEPIPGVFIIQEQRKIRQDEIRNSREQLIKVLSTPRNVRKKYEAPAKEVFAYRPWIPNSKPPRPERGRPFKKTKVPRWFQFDSNKLDFWCDLRFPVSSRAKRAVPSRKIIALSQPKFYPEKPIEKPPKRKKMSSLQWRRHQLRLLYLAMPNTRALAELCANLCPGCGYPFRYD